MVQEGRSRDLHRRPTTRVADPDPTIKKPGPGSYITLNKILVPLSCFRKGRRTDLLRRPTTRVADPTIKKTGSGSYLTLNQILVPLSWFRKGRSRDLHRRPTTRVADPDPTFKNKPVPDPILHLANIWFLYLGSRRPQ